MIMIKGKRRKKMLLKIYSDGRIAFCHYVGNSAVPTQDYIFSSNWGVCHTLDTRHIPKVIVYGKDKGV